MKSRDSASTPRKKKTYKKGNVSNVMAPAFRKPQPSFYLQTYRTTWGLALAIMITAEQVTSLPSISLAPK